MGVQMSYGHEARIRPPKWLVAGLIGMAMLAGCLSASAASTARPSGSLAERSVLSREPLEIRSLDLREGAPGLFVDVQATGPIVWTSFRDADGRLIVELPNTEPARGVEGLAPPQGLVAAVDLERDTRANRPVTRLTIRTRQPVEHSLAADGGHLEVSLLPLGSRGAAAPARTVEPLPTPPAAEPASEVPASEVATTDLETESPSSISPPRAAADGAADAAPDRDAPVRLASLDARSPEPTPLPSPRPQETETAPRQTGTAENPVVAPPPGGAAASRLFGVTVVSTDDGAVLEVEGDGEFRYSFFSLDNPHRFVVDLDGVVNQSPQSAVQVGGSIVDRVRIAQFKPFPEPVSRVVFDLRRPSVPRLERTSDGLVVRFDGENGPVMAETGAAEAEPEAEPEGMADVAQPSEPAEPEPEPAEEMETVDMAPEGEAAEESRSVASIQGGAGDVSLQMDETEEPQEPREPRRVAEPAPRVAPPPAGDELEVFEAERQEPEQEEPEQPRIRRERVTPAAGVPEGGSFEVQTVGESDTPYVGQRIDMSVREADVVEVLRMFAQISGLNVVIQPGIRGTVTVELTNVPWDQALEQVLKINGLGFELEGNIMRIAPVEQLRQEAEERQRLEQAKALSVPLNTIIKRLSYANANQVASLLRVRGGVLSQRGSVIVDGRTNTMIIKELPDFMDSVIAIIETLDTPEPQVMIEARIVETTKRFSRTLGISWSFAAEASAELGTNTGLEFPNNVDASGGVNLLTGGDNAFFGLTLGNVLNSFVLDARLQAAENEGLINILSAPKVATLNNQQASIQSGLQIPVQTVANNTVTVQFVNATLELRVTPQVTAEGTILMDISIAKREPQLAFAVQGASNAPIATSEATTRVIVRDGGTTVIGGIYEVSTDQGEDRVPGLANIPIIGHLFRNKRQTDENEELLIFITPRVINL